MLQKVNNVFFFHYLVYFLYFSVSSNLVCYSAMLKKKIYFKEFVFRSYLCSASASAESDYVFNIYETHCRYVSTFQLNYEDNFEGACCTWYKFLKKLHASMHFWYQILFVLILYILLFIYAFITYTELGIASQKNV